MNKIWWLFCTVIDNFGDIGVSWRLARELRTRLDGQIYLFLDDWQALRKIAPDFADERNIMVKSWREGEWADLDGVLPPNVVIEMFACRLPETVLMPMKQQQALWLNWEYLSAEDWAIRTHGMRSLQADGYAKYFWQMGFVAESGGLLRESSVGLPMPLGEHAAERVLKVLIFGYRSAVWVEMLSAWQSLGWQMEIDLAGSQVIDALKETGWLPENALTESESAWVSGSLILRKRDFVPQVDFDAMLAQYDWLFVRGEDSFIRAQWAAKPFFWHIYPQAELAHLDKLDAFWNQAFGDEREDWQAAHWALSQALNGGESCSESAYLTHWQTLRHHERAWQRWARDWQIHLYHQMDTVSKLEQWLAQSAK